MFLVQLLEEYHVRDRQELEAMSFPELEDNPDEYEIEEIREKRTIKGKIHYLVK